jgi:hypothetical protein
MEISRRGLRIFLAAGAGAVALASVSGGSGAVVQPKPLATTMPPSQFGAPTGGKERAWLNSSRPLAPGAPRWARRLYSHSLLVLRRLSDPETGAVVAGARPGWDHVWPRDAAAAALALQASGHSEDARRIGQFLLDLDAERAARFSPDGDPIPGRPAAGDAQGWIAIAARGTGLPAPPVDSETWKGRQDWAENDSGDFLGNAIAGGALGTEITARFEGPHGLTRGSHGEGLDSAAAWAVYPFWRPWPEAQARRTLLNLAAGASRFGIPPMEGWTGGEAWSAPTAWTALALERLGERKQADRLLAALKRSATPQGMLPERVDDSTGTPLSTTPLAWSHAWAVLALLERYPPQG